MTIAAIKRRTACLSIPCSVLLIIVGVSLSGCALFGIVAHAIPKPPIQASYQGLQNQRIAIMVWADRAIRIDWPQIQLDTANSIQIRMSKPKDEKGKDLPLAKELKGATFPYSAASVARFQRDHPEAEGKPITEVAVQLNVSRLIYLEIEQFQTRSDAAVELFRGTMIGTLRVVEVTNGVGKLAYEENDVRVDFPKKSVAEGMPDLGDAKTYAATVSLFAKEVVNRFVEHPAEDD
jgi:hypothetical protein